MSVCLWCGADYPREDRYGGALCEDCAAENAEDMAYENALDAAWGEQGEGLPF